MTRYNRAIAIPAIAVAMLFLMAIGALIMDKASSNGVALFGLLICAAGLALACVLTFLVEW